MKSMYQMWKDGEINSTERNDYYAIKRGYKDFNDYQRDQSHKSGRNQSMSENKKCSLYLGVHIAERYLAKIWDNVIRMPNGNPYFDFVCGKGFRVQVKSACITNLKVVSKYGHIYYYKGLEFNINKNKITDYFLLLAFDDRDNLNPIKIWLIKGTDIVRCGMFNFLNKFIVRISKIDEFREYELNDKLKKLIKCCNKSKQRIKILY